MEPSTILQGHAIGLQRAAADLRDAGARGERLFFSGMAIAFALTAFAGFSRTYYLNGFADTPFALTPILHWHGALFTAWILLLVTQTSLVAAGRSALHRRLGAASVALAAAMVVLGVTVAVTRTSSGAMALPYGVPPLTFLAVPVIGMVVFAGLYAAALHLRARSAAHKRLMLLATLELVTAGVGRLPVVESWGPLGFFGVTDLFIVAIAGYDLASLKRLHPATLWGGLFFIASQPLRMVIGGTAAWTAFAAWLTS
jgi:hypothetical protein